MTKKNEPLLIEDKMFQYNIWCWWGGRLEMCEWAMKELGFAQADAQQLMTFKADCQMTPFVSGKGSLIHMTDKHDIGDTVMISALAHEAQHVAFDVLNSRGLRYCEDSEEAYCYYTSWLFDQLMEVYGLNRKEEEWQGESSRLIAMGYCSISITVMVN